MKKLILFLPFAMLLVCANVAVAQTNIMIGKNYYDLDSNARTATLVRGKYSWVKYSGNVVISSSVSYADITYTVTSIGENVFSDCTGLTSITIPNSVTSIGDMAFYGCTGLTSITIPTSVTSIGYQVFSGCTGLTSVTIPNSVTSILAYTFEHCESLTSITIPNSVTSIGDYVFLGCTSLTSITIPNSVTSIGTSVLYGCTSLTSITIPNSVTSIGSNAFYGCTGLTSVTLPDSMPRIEAGMFYNCTSLTNIDIPNSVRSIGTRAFSNCNSLTHVDLPDSLTGIGSSAFNRCSNLTSITIPNSLTTIGDSAFSFCSSLASFTFPKSVRNIRHGAFKECTSLRDIIAQRTDPSNYTTTTSSTVWLFSFDTSTYNKATLHIPAGSLSAYKSASPWNKFKSFKQYATEVTLNQASLTLTGAGQTATLTATVSPDATDKSVTWSSSDESIATVSSEGIVTAVASGTITITATTADGSNLTATCEVTVAIPGDVNADNSIDVADYIALANYILSNAPANFIRAAADINADNFIDVADYIGLANLILNGSSVAHAPKPARLLANAPMKAPTDISTLTNALYVEPLEAVPGTQQELSIQMKNAVDVAGFEFSLRLPAGITVALDGDSMPIAELSTERTTKSRTTNFNSAIQADGTLKVLCGTTAKNTATGKLYTFSGNTGEVARITVDIPAGFSEGVYDVDIVGGMLADPDAAKTTLEPVITSALTVNGSVTLDEDSDVVPASTTGDVNIKVKRTIKGGEWSTICLPFDMTENQLYDAFGTDVKLAEFDSYDVDCDAANNVVSITINFTDANLADGLYANYPYIIKTSADISEFNTRATITPDEENALVEYDNGLTGKRREVYGTFYGTYHANTTVPAKGIFISANKFYYSKGLTKMKAFRAYFMLEDILSSVEGAQGIRMKYDDATTGVSSIVRNGDGNVYYDLQGRSVVNPSNGIYIQGGSKVYIKK